jgi:uncharacterized protein (TIGR03435 family)
MPFRKALLSVAAIALAAHSQSPPVSTSLKFEVASLKPSEPGGRGSGVRPAPGGERYLATNSTVKSLITVAYRIKSDEVTGGPAWIETDRYDMNAKAERPSSIEELHMMLKNLLADEFKLRFHRAMKELPVYALVVDKDGPKLTPHESPGASETAGETWIEITADPSPELFLRRTWHATLTPMDYFAFRLGEMLDRPVVNLTELKGSYDFDLSFTMELPPGAPEHPLFNGVAVDTSGPRVFEAIHKLGLRLESKKHPVEIMVIDHAEKPSTN